MQSAMTPSEAFAMMAMTAMMAMMAKLADVDGQQRKSGHDKMSQSISLLRPGCGYTAIREAEL